MIFGGVVVEPLQQLGGRRAEGAPQACDQPLSCPLLACTSAFSWML